MDKHEYYPQPLGLSGTVEIVARYVFFIGLAALGIISVTAILSQ